MFGILETYKRWVVWEPRANGLKTDKVPVDPVGLFDINPHDIKNQMFYTDAFDHIDRLNNHYGIGFVIAEEDPFFFIDIDACLNQNGSGWNQDALYLTSIFPKALQEVSQSGEGLHIIASWNGGKPHECKSKQSPIFDLYTKSRFVALTGINIQGDPGTNYNDTLVQLIDAFLVKSVTTSLQDWSEEPVAGWSGPESNEELIQLALRSRSTASIIGGHCAFADLWECRVDALVASYPPDGNDAGSYDESRADAALAQHLAFWTGKNCERIRTLMFKSSLSREKWEREDYLYRTIIKACSMQKTVFGENPPFRGGSQKQRDFAGSIREEKLDGVNTDVRTLLSTRSGPAASPTFWINNRDKNASELAEMVKPLTADVIENPAQLVNGFQYMPVEVQLKHFKGCTYILDLHRIITPEGMLLRQDQFNAMYGGYVFQLDEMGEKTTKKAWEAFTESQAARFQKVHTSCFRPDMEPGSCIQAEDGRTMVNVYTPAKAESIEGDVGPFIGLMEKMLPDETDRLILISYMAAIVQYPGVKFQWCPLIQGAEGNGKTCLTRCVKAAVGKKYTHFPKASDIDNKFNGWLLNKIFISVEDVYVPENRMMLIETLKPMITSGDGLEIQLKGVDQISADLCCNFILNSNHRDAIRKTPSDRRFAVFYTAQQTEEDLKRDGMEGEYFPRLYSWLRNGGYAHVTYYLKNFRIPDAYNPATLCHRAPQTSSTFAAIASSLGGVEQEIIEAIEAEETGFAGGWVSSVALDNLLHKAGKNRSIPQNKRRDMLNTLGYEWHPGLKNGRANNPVFIDGGKKPRLFIRKGHEAAGITVPIDIVNAYIRAQEEKNGG